MNTVDKEKMFPTSKKIVVGATASLFDLKAELFKRKQEAASSSSGRKNFDNLASNESSSNRPSSLQQPKWRQMAEKLDTDKNMKEMKRDWRGREVKNKNQRENELEDQELENNLKKSREALERKTRQYEQRFNKAKQGVPKSSKKDSDDEEDEEELIDFDRKVKFDSKSRSQPKVQKRSPSPVDLSDDDSDPDWVEFTDSLGRTRKCLKKDLEHYKKLDDDTKEPEVHDLDNCDSDGDLIGPQPLFEPEPEPEPLGPLHYQSVQNNEIRDHGVGYFAFADDDDERKKQRDLLDTLRDQTKKQREARVAVKAKRKHAMYERLKKVAARKGVPFEEPASSSSEDDADADSRPIIEYSSRHDEVVARKEDVPRAWDVGKTDEAGRIVDKLKKTWNYSNFRRSADEGQEVASSSKVETVAKPPVATFVEKRRDERDETFAPPSSYFFDDVREKKPRRPFTQQNSAFKYLNDQKSTMPMSSSINDRSVPPPSPSLLTGPPPELDTNLLINEKLAFFKRNSTKD